jgi:hypothetical protein
MRWYYLLAVRAGGGLATDLVFREPDERTPVGWFFVLVVLSGVGGCLYARRLESHPDEAITRRAAMWVWIAAAPETFVVIPLFVMGLLSLPWQEGPVWENAVYGLFRFSPYLTLITAQGIATWLWVKRARRTRLREIGPQHRLVDPRTGKWNSSRGT